MSRPEFANINLNLESEKISKEEWENKFKEETGKSVEDVLWETMEKIDVKPLYTHDDIDNLEHHYVRHPCRFDYAHGNRYKKKLDS